MNWPTLKPLGRRVWVWVWIAIALLFLYPVEYRMTRLALLVGLVVAWVGTLVLWWERREIRYTLVVAAALPAIALSLPGRPAATEALRADYVYCLRSFRGVRYVWGGESYLGIDCSGLVRKGLIWAQLHRGVYTLNGRLIRGSLSLWWHDCTAEALMHGYRGLVKTRFESKSIARVDPAALQPGDLAVTTDGVHILAYLGNQTWIEADPGARQVMEITLPNDNQWLHVPVVILRWECLNGH